MLVPDSEVRLQNGHGTVPYDTAMVSSQTLNPADFSDFLVGPAAGIKGGASSP
jgi:hypothetical protein